MSKENINAVNVRWLTTTALMAAVLCVLGPLSLPIGPVPISLTSLALYFMVFMVGLYCVAGVGGLWFAQKLLKGMPELRIADFISEESP